MTLLQNDLVTQLAFSVQENRGVFALILGSGLSRAAEIPTGWEITLDLVRRVAIAQGIEEQADWATWYRDKTGKEPSYSALLQEVASSPEERRAVINRYIEPDELEREEGKKLPTKAHRAVAQLVRDGFIRVIVTTNFDRLLENALREEGIEPTVVASVDALTGAVPLTHSRCYVLKLHGDYKDARILNTDHELSAYPHQYNSMLDRIFDEHGLILCGWSADWDPALREALLRTPNRRYPVFWATRSALSSSAKELAEHRAARTISIASADEFFGTLQQRIVTLEQSRRQNPLSIELLVSSAKRYLARPEFRIQLDELLAQETERLIAQLDGADFSPAAPIDTDTIRLKVRRYESLTEPLARMAGVLGRWGTGSDLDIALDVLRGLHYQAGKVTSGTVAWLNMRSYPAVLVFTAYGIGLTRAGRWDALHKLFSATLHMEHRETKRVVSALFLWAWSGSDDAIWKLLEGLERRKTALSDHLLEVLTAWKGSFAGVESNFELLYERFELMGSLAALEENTEEFLESAISGARESNDALAWMPVGRSGWHGVTANILLQELQDEARVADLLKAGFARESRRYLELFVENFRRIARKIQWM